LTTAKLSFEQKKVFHESGGKRFFGYLLRNINPAKFAENVSILSVEDLI